MRDITLTNEDTIAEKFTLDGKEYYRYAGSEYDVNNNDNLFVGKFTSILLKASRSLTADEMGKIASIFGYYWKTIVKGTEPLTRLSLLGDNIIVFNHGLFENGVRLSRSGTPEYRFAQLVSELNDLLATGTKPRKYGDQLVEGIEKDVEVSVWIDEIEQSAWVDDKTAEKYSDKAAKMSPAEPVEGDSFAGKTAEELTFQDVKLLLDAFKAEQKKNAELGEANAKLTAKLEAVQAVFN